jgi:dTDP-4-dehydrorhamnose 3,5-epimerase
MFTPTTIPGLTIVEPSMFEDNRGFFFESYNEKHYHDNGVAMDFVQDNQSHSKHGVIRGLHFQAPPHAQTKLVRVLQGTIIDVAVDLRMGSPTYAQTFSIELSAANRKQLLIPKGFAHGFSVLSETADVLYKCDAYYNKDSERGIAWNDPELAIEWQIAAGKAVVSEKDRILPMFKDYSGEFLFIS